MRNSKEGLTFKYAKGVDFKNIPLIEVDINGKSFIIMGKNGAGKSSFIQLLLSALDTKIRPLQPVRAGEEKGSATVILSGEVGGKYKEYTIDWYFTVNDGKGRIVVTNMEGETVKSPATFIKSLIGNVSFDVTRWLNESKEKKLTTLKQLTGCSDKIDEINLIIKDLKEKKKFKSQRVEEIQAVLKNHGYSPEEVDKYSNPVDLVPIQTEMNEVGKQQQTYDGVVVQVQEFRDMQVKCAGYITKSEAEIDRLGEEIKRLQALQQEEKKAIEGYNADIEKYKTNVEKGEKWIASKVRPSIEAVSEKLNEAIVHNEHFNKIQVHAGQQKEMLAAKTELDGIASKILVEEKKRNDIVSSSQLPIPGLSFDDEQIYLDSLPLEEGQINKARLWDVGVDIAIALNPGLKTIFLHDGSLFDKEHMKAIIEKIENKGFQAIIEVVKSKGDLEVEFTEKFLAE